MSTIRIGSLTGFFYSFENGWFRATENTLVVSILSEKIDALILMNSFEKEISGEMNRGKKEIKSMEFYGFAVYMNRR